MPGKEASSLTASEICVHRLSIITGHYGTGKTEFSVNLALALAAENRQVALADLDIVNPYFRSRERKALLEETGVRLIATSQACTDADVPSLPAALLSVLEDRSVTGVLDIGGDPVGARVLARFRPRILPEDYQLIYVLNASRPEVCTPQSALSCLRSIEETTGLTCSGIVNNTHLCGETTGAEILRGAALAEAVSREAKIPVLCHVSEERLAGGLAGLREPVFPITVRMKKPWE